MQPGIILCTSEDSVLLWMLLLMCFCLNRQRAFFLPNVGVRGRLWFPSSSYRLIWILSRLSIRQYHPYILTSRTMSLKTFLEKILSPSWNCLGPTDYGGLIQATAQGSFVLVFLSGDHFQLPCVIDQMLWGYPWLASMRISRDFCPHLILGYQPSKKIIPSNSPISPKVFSWSLQPLMGKSATCFR